MGYIWDFSVIVLHPSEWLRGLFVTMTYAIATVAAGLMIGVVCGMSMLSRYRILTSPLYG